MQTMAERHMHKRICLDQESERIRIKKERNERI